MTIETIDLTGGENYRFEISEILKKVNPEIASKNDKVYHDLMMVRLLPGKLEIFNEGTDLMPQVRDGWLTVDIPKGEYVIYFVVKLTGYMAVINGAPGAAGPVLYHYNKPAVEFYLNRISKIINTSVGNMGDYIGLCFVTAWNSKGQTGTMICRMSLKKEKVIPLGLIFLSF